MDERPRGPGWDAQAIQRIANEHYGGLAGLFEAHGWPERENAMMPAQQSRVAEAYGTVAEFEHAHDPSALVAPLDAMKQEPPNVWLTSAYGFGPESWGYLGFTQERMRASFLRRSGPNTLVIVYGASASRSEYKGKIFGLKQLSRRIGVASSFMSDAAWKEKQENANRKDRWDYAIKIHRAWEVTPESRIPVQAFAPITYTPGRAQAIGAWGKRLELSEALRILDLDLREVPVFGGPRIEFSTPASARDVLKPSPAGPVSQSPYTVRGAEGPKHLYILKLDGDEDAFLGMSASDRTIVKVGFSKSPQTRCEDHNRALPRGAYKWIVEKSTFAEGRQPFASSGHAKAGEDIMKKMFSEMGESLGGEFFLAGGGDIEAAWRQAIECAQRWRTP